MEELEEELEIINLTSHDITVLDEQKNTVDILPKSGLIASLFITTTFGEPILINRDGDRVPFPEPKHGTIYVVSSIFRSGSGLNRADLWQPGELVRNDEGQPIGCIGLSQ